VFIPLTVGGGVRSVDEMRDVLRAGADKVGLNTRAVAEPTLVTACAARFGSQAVVVAIDARRVAAPDERYPSGFEVVVKGGREPAGLDAVAWAQRAVELGNKLFLTDADLAEMARQRQARQAAQAARPRRQSRSGEYNRQCGRRDGRVSDRASSGVCHLDHRVE